MRHRGAERTDADDDATLLAILGDDLDAFETFYRRHVQRLSAFAVRRCGTPDDVADVVAQTFVRLLDVADRYDAARGAPLAFLYAVAGNVIRDHHRAARRQQQLVFRLAGRELLDPDDTERITAAVDAARLAPAAQQAVGAVPPGEEAVLRLVAAGASTVQAAETLGIPAGTARVRLFRARRRVRSRLATDRTHPEEP